MSPFTLLVQQPLERCTLSDMNFLNSALWSGEQLQLDTDPSRNIYCARPWRKKLIQKVGLLDFEWLFGYLLKQEGTVEATIKGMSCWQVNKS